MMCPQFEWPKMPFSVRFVDPVQTATGVSFRVRTKNLLCMILPVVRGVQSPMTFARATAASFRLRGPEPPGMPS